MKTKEPLTPPPEPDSLEKLAKFTRRILQVRRDKIADKPVSSGPIPTEEPCPEV